MYKGSWRRRNEILLQQELSFFEDTQKYTQNTDGSTL